MTSPLTSATSSLQGDGSKVIQHKHSKASQSRKHVETTIPGDSNGHSQSDDNRLHGTGHRQ